MEYRICNRCIMDISDPGITFDKDGRCNHCRRVDDILRSEPFNLTLEETKAALLEQVRIIREDGRGKRYDCIAGISGGVDSTYMVYLAKKFGLRPLVVHLDNGWNSELSQINIENILKKLDLDLYTYVMDWDEFRDLQLAFLKASTPDSEVPSDHAIVALLYQTACREGVRYILAGSNMSTEAIMPAAWSSGYKDWKYISSIHRLFGGRKLQTFPHFDLFSWFRYDGLKKIKWVGLLNYLEYSRNKAKEILKAELNWKDYGEKHYESTYTKFYQAYILPKKFGFDKRRAHLSSMICSGQITREEALREMEKPLYPEDELKEDKKFVINKFQISEDEFERIMNLPARKFHDYPSYSRSYDYPYFQRTLCLKVFNKIYHLIKSVL